jgi:hypothetical protein
MRGLLVVLAALALSLPLSTPALAGTSGVELEYLADGSVLETAWTEEADGATAATFAYPTRTGPGRFGRTTSARAFATTARGSTRSTTTCAATMAPAPAGSSKGHVSRWSAGGAGKWSYTVGTQGHYAGCTIVTGCIVDD